jgi:hypothetical protein
MAILTGWPQVPRIAPLPLDFARDTFGTLSAGRRDADPRRVGVFALVLLMVSILTLPRGVAFCCD